MIDDLTPLLLHSFQVIQVWIKVKVKSIDLSLLLMLVMASLPLTESCDL